MLVDKHVLPMESGIYDVDVHLGKLRFVPIIKRP